MGARTRLSATASVGLRRRRLSSPLSDRTSAPGGSPAVFTGLHRRLSGWEGRGRSRRCRWDVDGQVRGRAREAAGKAQDLFGQVKDLARDATDARLVGTMIEAAFRASVTRCPRKSSRNTTDWNNFNCAPSGGNAIGALDDVDGARWSGRFRLHSGMDDGEQVTLGTSLLRFGVGPDDCGSRVSCA